MKDALYRKNKAGNGDPYWYEWSVGEQQIINMAKREKEMVNVFTSKFVIEA